MSSRGQVVIPKDVRDALGWVEGQALAMHRAGDRVVVEAASPPRRRISWEEFDASVPRYEGPKVTVEQMDAAIAEMWRHRADEAKS